MRCDAGRMLGLAIALALSIGGTPVYARHDIVLMASLCGSSGTLPIRLPGRDLPGDHRSCALACHATDDRRRRTAIV